MARSKITVEDFTHGQYAEGETIRIPIGEHIFETPPIPAHKDILFHNLPQKEQYWRRQTDFPSLFFDWWRDSTGAPGPDTECEETTLAADGRPLTLNKEDTLLLFGDPSKGEPEGLQFREHRRMGEGVWFYNNGVPTYLTGDHYGSLQWFQMLDCLNEVEPGSQYGQYAEFQRDMAYFFLLCERADAGVGGFMVKPKKTGASVFIGHIIVNRARRVREKNLRMMSITEKLCKDLNFRHIAHAVNKLPPILMPTVSKLNEGEMLLGDVTTSRNPMKRTASVVNTLNNWISTVPTARTGFDSFPNYIAWIDEIPKIDPPNHPKEILAATKVAVRIGAMRVGTVFAMSYVPEKSTSSFYECRTIYKESKLNTRKKNEDGEYVGKTASDLICFTLTTDRGIFGCIDKFGKAQMEKIYEFIRESTEPLKNNPAALQAFKRAYPFTEQDPWQEAASDDTIFDVLRIGQQRIELEEQMAKGELPYIDFNFEFDKEPVKQKLGTFYDFPGIVKPVPVTLDQKRAGAAHGRWRVYDAEWLPKFWLDKHTNKREFHPKTGLLMPNPESPFFISIDPTNYQQRRLTDRPSLNAIMVFVLPDEELNSYCADRVSETRLAYQYLFRADRPSETLNDFVKAILYFGCMVQIECNMVSWAENLVEMGLEHFLLMINEETGALEPYNRAKKQKFFKSQEATIPWYVQAAQEHLAEPRLPHQIDQVKALKSLEVLEQLAAFNPQNTKEFDAAVAYMEGLMGIKAWKGWRRAEWERKNKKSGAGMTLALMAFNGVVNDKMRG